MSGIFGGGAPAPAPTPEPPPTIAHESVQAAADVQRKKARTASGRAATILTRPGGVQDEPTLGTTTLLGR
jgi:hypothetical protein